MNDRLKFRAWSIKENKYFYDVEDLYDYMQGMPFFYFGELIKDENYVVEQFTGLKDKNGKLIFENDIVCVEDWEQDKETGNMINFLGTVYWDNKNLCWSVKDEKNDLTWFDIDEYKIEVVGNIHENPELIGGK